MRAAIVALASDMVSQRGESVDGGESEATTTSSSVEMNGTSRELDVVGNRCAERCV